jgi:hypothetical protein
MISRWRSKWFLSLGLGLVVLITAVIIFFPREHPNPLHVKFLGITNTHRGSRYAAEITNRSNRDIYWRLVTGSTNVDSSLGSGLPYSTPFQSGVWRGSSRFNAEPPVRAHSAHYFSTIAQLESGEKIWLAYSSQTNSSEIPIGSWRWRLTSLLARNGFSKAAASLRPKTSRPQVEQITVP